MHVDVSKWNEYFHRFGLIFVIFSGVCYNAYEIDCFDRSLMNKTTLDLGLI
jgi:hypothetical protein